MGTGIVTRVAVVFGIRFLCLGFGLARSVLVHRAGFFVGVMRLRLRSEEDVRLGLREIPLLRSAR